MDENNTNENSVNENNVNENNIIENDTKESAAVEDNNEVKEFRPQTTLPPSAFEMPSENKTTVTTGTPVSTTSSFDSSQTNAYNSAGSYYTAPTTSAGSYYTDPTTSAQESFSTGFAIASLVLGILSILTSCCCGLGLILGILGIIFGCVQQKNPLDQKPAMAIVGIVLSVVGILATLAFLVYYYMVGSAL